MRDIIPPESGFENPFASAVFNFPSWERIKESLDYLFSLFEWLDAHNFAGEYGHLLNQGNVDTFYSQYYNAQTRLKTFWEFLTSIEAVSSKEALVKALNAFNNLTGNPMECIINYNGRDTVSVAVFNNDMPLGQLMVVCENGEWRIDISICFFEINGSIVEIRNSIEGKTFALAFRPNSPFNVIAAGRDVQDALAAEVPTDEFKGNNGVFIRNLVANDDICYFDIQQVAPQKARLITIYNSQDSVSERIDVVPSESGFDATLEEIIPDKNGTDRKVILKYKASSKSLYGLDVNKLRLVLKNNENVMYKSEITKIEGQSIPFSTTVDMESSNINSLSIFFTEEGAIRFISLDGEYFDINTEVTLYPTPDRAYIMLFHKEGSIHNMQRLKVSFTKDYHVLIIETNPGPVFEVVNGNLWVDSNLTSGNLNRTISLN